MAPSDALPELNTQAPPKSPSLPTLDTIQMVRIPVCDDVALTRRVVEIIDHPAFQRLRRIRQLGPTSLIYPGAVHSRFEHSIGVYATVKRYLNSLLRHQDVALSLSHEDLLTVLAAGLLHDIGHYPFAHSLEALHYKEESLEVPKHEALGMAMIIGDDQCLGAKFLGEMRFLRDHHGRTLGEILQKDWGVSVDRVSALCTGDFSRTPETTSVDHLLKTIISSAIDADKMDYLWRDSLHAGVPYGRNYDKERLLNALTINENCDSIALDAKGKIPAEIFIFGRYMMFSEVYWHHTNRAASVMVEMALNHLYRQEGKVWDAQQVTHLLLHLDDDNFLHWLFSQFEENSPGYLLMHGLVGHRRALYKRIATYSMVYQEEVKQQAYQRLYKMSYTELAHLIDAIECRLSQYIGTPIMPGMIAIDTPPRDKDTLDSVEIVYPDAYGRKYYGLHELSKIVAGIQDDFVKVVKKIRVFAHPSLVEQIRKKGDVERVLLELIL